METAERQEYPAMLPQLQPPHAVSILNERVQQVGRLNLAIADWLQERRRVEEQYATGLRRLSQRSLDGLDLGTFSGPWAALTGSVDTLAESHALFATKIEVDVERPLREFVNNNREMAAMSTVQGNLGALAKDVERAQQKAEKLRGKGDKADGGKVANAGSDLDTAQAQWDSLAPPVFSSLQSLDETRLNHLRDTLTQYQTHETDQVERSRVSGEQCLMVLLNMQAADEIKTFSLKAVQTRPTLAKARQTSTSYGTPTRTATPGASNALAQTQSRSEEDLTRERTASTDDKAKGRLKGLRSRVGTVMGRKRESKMPVGATDSPEARPRASPMNSASRFTRSRDNAPTLATMQETTPRQRPTLPAQLGSEIFDAPAEVRADPSTPTEATRDIGTLPQINGTPFSESFQPASSSAFANGTHQSDMNEIEPPQPVFSQRKESLRALEGQKDSEGFTIPPQNLDPISQAQQDAAFADDGSSPALNVNIRDTPLPEDAAAEADLASAANKLQAPPPSTKRTSTIRGRRTDRNSTIPSAFIPAEQPILEPGEAAFSPASRETSDTTLTQPAYSEAPSSGVTDGAFTISPSSTFGPGPSQLPVSTSSAFAPIPEQQSPPQLDTRTPSSMDQLKTDARSIRSATTTGSQGGIKHPDLTEPGLNSSIVETLTARSDKGEVVSSSLIGEIALAYNSVQFPTPLESETIRLENFSSLEKVAPNPAFIKQIPDKEGEYSVNLSSIAKTQVAFKYQARLEQGDTLAPLLITSALKIEPNQCSVIVSYSLNSNFALHGQESVILSNVTLALTIEGTKAAGCQSKPVGTFVRERNLIYWPLNDITLVPGAAPTKLLARFATDSEATGASVEARWEIAGPKPEDLGSALSVSVLSSGNAGESSDPFADELAAQAAAWKPVQGVRKLTSGSYVAK